MDPRITEQSDWYCVEGTEGIWYYPAEEFEEDELEEHYPGVIEDIEKIEGYGVRIRPDDGCLDDELNGEWAVFETKEEAEEYSEELDITVVSDDPPEEDEDEDYE